MKTEDIKDRIKIFIELGEDFHYKGLTFNFRGDKIIISSKYNKRIVDYNHDLSDLPELLCNEYVTEEILRGALRHYNLKVSGDFVTYLKNILLIRGILL